MSTTISDYIKKCQFVASEMLNEQERIVLDNEDKIISLNVDTFQDGLGSDDKSLFNTNKRYSGRYTIFTQLYAQESKPRPIGSKIAGYLYNFAWHGDFLSNMQIDLQPNLVKFDIFSTGTGSGEKALFFSGYNNLFGLNKNNSDIVNYEIILPELQKFVKRYL